MELIDNELFSIDFNQDCPIEEKSEPDRMNDSAASPNTIKLNKKRLDDDEETFETVFDNLPNDLKPLKDCMYKAQGCCLLLVLKQFLKEVYAISEM